MQEIQAQLADERERRLNAESQAKKLDIKLGE